MLRWRIAHNIGNKSVRIPSDSMVRITENIRRKLKVDADEVGEYSRLLSKYADIKRTSADDSTVGQSVNITQNEKSSNVLSLANTAAPIPGSDPLTAQLNLPLGTTELKTVLTMLRRKALVIVKIT